MYNYVIDAPPPSAYGYVRRLGQLCNALGLELRSTALGITQLPLASYISIDPREGVHLSPKVCGINEIANFWICILFQLLWLSFVTDGGFC